MCGIKRQRDFSYQRPRRWRAEGYHKVYDFRPTNGELEPQKLGAGGVRFTEMLAG